MNATKDSRTTKVSQPPPRIDANAAAQLDALKSLECDLAEATYMAGIAADLMEDAFANLNIHRELAGGRKNLYYLTRSQVDHLIFASNHTLDMVNDIHAKFLDIAEGPREAGEEVRP